VAHVRGKRLQSPTKMRDAPRSALTPSRVRVASNVGRHLAASSKRQTPSDRAAQSPRDSPSRPGYRRENDP
jgi:hypothetical protein